MKPTSVVSVALAAGFVVLAGYLMVRSLTWPLIHDAPLMHYIAWRISAGAVPYRDLFDMNFPGTYLVHLAAFRLFGSGDLGWRLFDAAWLITTSAAAAALAWRWGRTAAAGTAGLFAAYHLAGGAAHVGQRDFLLTLFLLLGSLGAARWWEGGRLVSLVWSGAALGVGLTIKPHAALLAALLAGVVAGAPGRGDRGILVPIVTFVTAAILPAAAVAIWVAASGGGPAWRDIVLNYLLPFYARLGRPPSWTFHRWHLWIPMGAAVIISLAHAAQARRFTVRHGVAALGVAYGLAHHVGQAKGWEYHLYPLAAFAGVLAFSEIGAALRSRSLVAAPLVASLALVLVLVAHKGAEAADADWIRDKERVVDTLTRDLGPIAHGETVQVLDTTGGGVHALLRLRAVQPTRFLYDFHFFHDPTAPAIRALRAELIRDLAARSPRYVVVFEDGWPVHRSERLALFPELHRWLADGYRTRNLRPHYVIYARRD